MQIDMTGKAALVTGARRGIGAGVARAFRQAGARVAIAQETPRRSTGLVRARLETQVGVVGVTGYVLRGAGS